MIIQSIALIFILGGGALTLFAQEPLTKHTFKLSPGKQSPAAKIDAMEWLAGHWIGNDSDGLSEEIWSPPRDGMMMGMYRFIQQGKPIFYEFMTLVEDKGSLIIRLKHFTGDLVGWEEKNKTVDFPLVLKSKDIVHFEGMSFQRNGKNSITIFLAIRQKNGSFQEEIFHFQRVSVKSK